MGKPLEAYDEEPAVPAKTKPTPAVTEESGNGIPAEPEITYEEYELRRKELVERLPEVGARPKNLVAKLALITGLVGQIRKSGENTFHHYRYAKESDLVEAIRPLLSELGIWVWWSLFADPEKGIKHHERLSQTKKDRDGNITGEANTLTAVAAHFKFIDGDTKEETEPQLMMGYGDDNSDKGLYKALTGMEKYFLFKTFLVSTGDDPEGDTRADARAARREGPPEVRRSSSQGGRSQPQRGGRQQEASSPQVRQLGELLRKAGLAKSSIKTLEYFTEQLGRPFPVEDGDPATTLQTALRTIKPEEMGKLIASLRASQEEEQPAAVEEAQDVVGDSPAGEDVEAAGPAATEVVSDEEEDAGPIA